MNPIFVLRMIFGSIFIVLLVSSCIAYACGSLEFLFGFTRNDVDNSAHRLRTIEGRRSSFDYFDMVDIIKIDSRIVDVATVFARYTFAVYQEKDVFGT